MDAIFLIVDNFLSTTGLDAIDALRAFFLTAACTALSVNFLPFPSRLVTYGARATSIPQPPPPAQKGLVDYVASLSVPHSYFTHFYVASVLSSVFWAVDVLRSGPGFSAVVQRVSLEHLQTSMSLYQVLLCWALLMVQAFRRLFESVVFAKPSSSSSSRMWFVHWLLGIAFYMAASIAIWIEGAGTLLSENLQPAHFRLTTQPSLRTFLCLPLFLLASGIQHDSHQHLFTLKRYTLPTHPLFRRVVSPHYTAECVIYLSLALLAAPQGELINKTLLCCTIFVTVNLGITASSTKQWYIQKFGREAVADRWKMIPGVY